MRYACCCMALLVGGAALGCGDGGASRDTGQDTAGAERRTAAAESGARPGPPAVEVVSDSLFLVTLTSGETVRFEDTLAGDPSADRDYAYERLIPELGGVLIHVGYWEGHAYYLLRRGTGDTIRLDSPPIFSPGETRFATVSRSLVSGYDPNRLRVFQATGDSITPEHTVEPGETLWGPSDARWVGEDTLRFVRNRPHREQDARCTVTPMRLVHGGDGWRLDSLEGRSREVAGPCP